MKDPHKQGKASRNKGANGESLKKLSGFYDGTQGTTEQRVKEYTRNVLNNIEGL